MVKNMVHSFWRVLMFLDDNIYVIANISKREAVSGQNVFEVFWVDCYRQGDEQILKMLDFLSFWCRAAWIEKKTEKICSHKLQENATPLKKSRKNFIPHGNIVITIGRYEFTANLSTGRRRRKRVDNLVARVWIAAKCNSG